MKKILLFTLVIVLSINMKAQISNNLPSILNYSILNPAAIGLDNSSISLYYSTPFSGVNNSPKNQTLHYQRNFNDMTGAGISINNNSAGPSSTINFTLSYSHVLKIQNDLKLALGLSGGFKAFSLNEASFILDEEMDYAILGVERKEIFSNANTGVVLIDNKWKFGLSAHNLINTELFSRGVTNDSILNLTLSGYFDFKQKYEDFLLVPSVRITNNNTEFDIDLNLLTTYKEVLLLGVSLQELKSISFTTGLKRGNLQFNYAYSFPSSEVYSMVTGGHHLYIQLDLNQK